MHGSGGYNVVWSHLGQVLNSSKHVGVDAAAAAAAAAVAVHALLLHVCTCMATLGG